MKTPSSKSWPLALLAFVMALCIGLSAWAFLAHRALTDAQLYRSQAMSAVPERTARFEARVREIAAEVGFDPQTALDFYPPERIRAIAGSGVDWMLGILNGHAASAPDLSAVRETAEGVVTLADAIFDDPAFEGPRRVARDDGQGAVQAAAARCLLPLRSSMLTLTGNLTQSRAAAIRTGLRLISYASWILAGLAFAAGAAICFIRRKGLQFAYAGAGLAGGGLGGACILIPLAVLDIPSVIGEVSPAFAEEVRGIVRELTTRHLVCCGALFAVGLALFIAFFIVGGRRNRAA